MVIKEHTLHVKDTMMTPTLAVEIMEWLYVYMFTFHISPLHGSPNRRF